VPAELRPARRRVLRAHRPGLDAGHAVLAAAHPRLHGARVNLCACLGVGPGHRLLLGPVTPTAAYDRASAPPLATPVRMGEVGTPRPAYRRRPRRSREEARLLYARVKAKVEAGMEAKRDQYEVRDEIAESE